MARTINKYVYPVALDAVTATAENTTSGSHNGPYKGSVDFAVPLGTIVYAAADGVVTRVRNDSKKHGTTIDFGHDVNYVTIEHSNNEISEYLHLAKGSALVKAGDDVTSGQPIAKTGLSGWLFAPHLHFMVYKKIVKPEDFQCLDVRFR
jgi:murein DD-endopeptidase MepM/ murein hydrolase activator NlpD